jgi:hypothetical protein
LAPAVAGDLLDGVVATVLDITVKAWPHLRQKNVVGPNSDEDSISNQLRWEMDAEKRRRRPEPQLRFEREAQSDDPLGGTPTGLIDIYVVYSFHQTEFFAMECKKVNDKHVTPCKKYIENGVRRFTNGKYSFGHPYAAMIAFVTDGTTLAAAQFMNTQLTSYDQLITCLDSDWGWRVESRFGTIPDLYSTRHNQTGSTNRILLLHLFLDIASPN